MSDEEEAARKAAELHQKLFESALTRARELEASLPPVGSPKETLAHIYVHTARLFAYDQDEPDNLIDFEWLLLSHIESVQVALERYRIRKETGQLSGPKMN
jgi:hypothetical protein